MLDWDQLQAKIKELGVYRSSVRLWDKGWATNLWVSFVEEEDITLQNPAQVWSLSRFLSYSPTFN